MNGQVAGFELALGSGLLGVYENSISKSGAVVPGGDFFVVGDGASITRGLPGAGSKAGYPGYAETAKLELKAKGASIGL